MNNIRVKKHNTISRIAQQYNKILNIGRTVTMEKRLNRLSIFNLHILRTKQY